MRIALIPIIAFGCSVPHKEAPDAGRDASPPDAPSDTTPPETTITSQPAMFANANAARFEFTADKAGSTFECSVDNSTPTACTSPFTQTLSDGNHSFSVRAIDPAGLRDPTPAEVLWTIDTVAPDTTLTQFPPLADNSVMVKFSFVSNEMNVTFECSMDGASYLPCKSGDQFGPLGDGTHTFAVRAHDRAGNVDASPAIRAWTIDTTMPDTTIVTGPPDVSASTTATFTFISPDAGAGATFTCSLDGGGYMPCTSPRNVGPLAEGTHTFAVKVRDAVGNVDPTPATDTWLVDLTPPTTTITSGPSGTVTIASAAFTFVSNEANSTFQCTLDSSPYATCTSPFTATGLTQGAHNFAVRAIDAAGHVDPTPATRAWSVDTIPPDVEITAGPNGTSGPYVQFAFTASDGAVTCSLDNAAFTACASPIAYSLPAGPHQFRVRAIDGAGNLGSAMRSWTVVCTAPDTLGAAALLHLDDNGQTLANAVAGGAPATLGDTIDVEPGDPAFVTGRFAGGLGFTAAESDHVAWPVALPAMPELTIEAWAAPNAPAGARDLVVSGDGRVALRVTAASPTTVRFSITIVEGGMAKSDVVTSAPVAAGQWHHVLASLAEPTLFLWIDGVRVQANNVHPGTPPALDSLRLGGGGGTAYSGLLDEVWIAQTAITTDDAALARYCPL
jgi:hypothetical protein